MANYNLNYTGDQVKSILDQANGLTYSSTTVTGNGLTMYLYKYGRIVYATVIGGTIPNALAASATILTVPVAYRPIKDVEARDSNNLCRLRILSGGAFNSPNALAANAGPRVSFCYITA